MKEKFPIIYHPPYSKKDYRCRMMVPRYVPWKILIAFEDRVIINHGQTLERLAERGGLSPEELACVLEDIDFDKTLTLKKSLDIIEFYIPDDFEIEYYKQ